MFKESTVTTDGVMFRKVIEEVLAPPSKSTKTKQRLAIEEQVFDIHDSVADTTKWLSLLSSMVARMYAVMPQEQKDAIPQDEKNVIEYAMAKFLASTTRADVQMQQEGVAMIDKIFTRQTQISNIVK